MSNIHENCENYSPKKDYCLKFFEENVSEKYKVCSLIRNSAGNGVIKHYLMRLK